MVNRCAIASWKDRTDKTHQEHIAKYGGKQVKTLLLGDSMFERLKYHWPENPSICNAGVGGDKTQNVLWRLEAGLLKEVTAEKIILMIGTNNLESDSAENICEGITAIIDRIKEDSPSSELVVLGILPRNDSPSNKKMKKISETLQAVNKWLSTNLDVSYYDHSELFSGKSELYDDHVHLNETGYKVWSEALTMLI